MRTQKKMLNGLLGAMILAVGVTTPMSVAADKAPPAGEDTVDVRIKLPDGSVVIQKARRHSSRLETRPSSSTTRRLPDGSRVSVSSSSSGSTARRTSGARSATRGTSSAAKPASTGRRAMTITTRPVAAQTDHDTTPTTNDTVDTDLNIPTIGNARHSGTEATGGQSVYFEGTGMYGAVIGQTLYLSGVELASVDQAFEVISGTRIGGDTTIMDEAILALADNEPGSLDKKAPLKVLFESDTVVTVVMYSQSGGTESGAREERTWTVRIR